MSFCTSSRAHTLLILFLALTLWGTPGCSTAQSKEEAQKRMEELKTRMKNYASLENEIREQRIAPGMRALDIRETFGAPDDVFKSGSGTGSFEIWTYEKVTAIKDEEGWENIKLYFDNGKLVSWNF